MTETPISLQDLRERISIKAKADKNWRFWGLYVHVCKMETLYEAYKSFPIEMVIATINPILRGWVNYFRIGNSSDCFSYIKEWVELKVRRHLQRARVKPGFGWRQWSKEFIYKHLKLYSDYKVRYC
jgi:RNA-directed DNA polymerase